MTITKCAAGVTILLNSVICFFRKGKGTMCTQNCKSKELLGFLKVTLQQNSTKQELLPYFYMVNNKCDSVSTRKLRQILFLVYSFFIKIFHQKHQISAIAFFLKIDALLFLTCSIFSQLQPHFFQGENCIKQFLQIINHKNTGRYLC